MSEQAGSGPGVGCCPSGPALAVVTGLLGVLVREEVAHQRPQGGAVPTAASSILPGDFWSDIPPTWQVTALQQKASRHGADSAGVLSLQHSLSLNFFGNPSFNSYQVQFAVKLAGS